MGSYFRYPLHLLLWAVAIMSGALSILREGYTLYSGQLPAKPLFWSCVRLAFMLSAAILWYIEHKARKEAEARTDHGKPHFALEVVEEIHAYTPNGYFFWITNCGERSARNVTFDPIRSKRSRHYIRLDPQVVLDPHKRRPITFHCGVEDEPFGTLEGNSGRLVLFCDDNPDKEPRLYFDVAIRCLDGDRQLEEHHTLEVSVASTGAKLKIYPTPAKSTSPRSD